MTKNQNPKQVNLTIFIDESGTLPDPKDKFIVICAVGVKRIEDGQNIISRVLSSLRQTRKYLKEIKFYYAGQNTKRQFLSGMVAADFEIFALVVDKKGRKIADTPENFALLVADLMNEVFLWYKVEQIVSVIDKHFFRKVDQNRFDKCLETAIDGKIGWRIQITHVDSQDNPLVNIADMAAGSVLWKYSGKDTQFYNIIKENVIIEKIISWPEIKRKNIAQKQKLT